MLLSRLLQEIDGAVGRFGELVVAVGAINGTWRALNGIGRLGRKDDTVAFLAAGDVAYFRTDPISAADLRNWIETYIAENGDMKVGVVEGGHFHDFIDLNVDQDVGEDGEDVNVMVVQAYVVKPSLTPPAASI